VNLGLGHLNSRDLIVDAGYPTRSYVCGACGLLKVSNVAAPIGHGFMRLGGKMCRLHEVGKGPTWVLGNVEIARDFRYEISVCHSSTVVSPTFPSQEAPGLKVGPRRKWVQRAKCTRDQAPLCCKLDV
jgi:hypothetical protein